MAKCNNLVKAVNEYLAAQNFAGYLDGNPSYNGQDERCAEARQNLCEVVYQFNLKRKNG